MKSAIVVLELITCVLLVGNILLQVKGTGLGSAFGGNGEMYQSKRGVEKIVFYATIALSFLFAIFSLLLLILP